MATGITLETGKYGLRAVIASPWSEWMTSFLLDKNVSELELNDGKGWLGSELNFLAELPQLLAIRIIDFKIKSVEPIHFLHELRAAEVMTYCKTEMRFSAFPRLEDCGLEWRPGGRSLFECTTLKSLFVNNYDGDNTEPFKNLRNLESLSILNAPIKDLRGLSGLKRLRSLRLANMNRLASLAGIEHLSNLEELEIHTCRSVRSIDEIGYLRHLRSLNLNNDGDIESLKPLARLTGLESILFYESTNILDGNLAPLLAQKNLSRVSFQNRRHYSHRREEFGAACGGRVEIWPKTVN